MTSHNVHRNLAMRDAIKIARDLGIDVYKNSNGEWRFDDPLRKRDRLNLNHKRKDAGKILVSYLRRSIQIREGVVADGDE